MVRTWGRGGWSCGAAHMHFSRPQRAACVFIEVRVKFFRCPITLVVATLVVV